jgi:hypothetical protein
MAWCSGLALAELASCPTRTKSSKLAELSTISWQLQCRRQLLEFLVGSNPTSSTPAETTKSGLLRAREQILRLEDSCLSQYLCWKHLLDMDTPRMGLRQAGANQLAPGTQNSRAAVKIAVDHRILLSSVQARAQRSTPLQLKHIPFHVDDDDNCL